MQGKALNIVLGIIFYALGAMGASQFLAAEPTWFFFHPSIELALISTGVFILSGLFYGKYPFIMMAFAGIFLGPHLQANQMLVICAGLPLLVASMGGAVMGENAALDLRGKGNFFGAKKAYFAVLAAALALSAAIGIFIA